MASDGSSYKRQWGNVLPAPQFCDSAGVRLAVYCQGDPSKPNIVLVHGYPDNSSVWNLLVEYLANTFYVIRYDVRGAGNSSAPTHRSGYLLSCLQADLEAVVAQFCTQAQFHLLAHDWGSVQCWESVCCPRFQKKIASYTSISGPSLDHAGHWFRRRWQERGGKWGVIKQVFRSWYIWFFHLPLFPSLLWRMLLGRSWRALLVLFEGLNPAKGELCAARQRARDGVNGINLYKANCISHFHRPRWRMTWVPIQVVVASDDRFLNTDLCADIGVWAPNVVTRSVHGVHWLPLSRPSLVASLVADFVQANPVERRDLQ